VLGDDVIGCRHKAGQPSAQIERIDLERQRGVIDRNR